MLSGRQGSLAVVVSPLISLMMDQRQKFSPTELAVEFVGEAQMVNAICINILKGQCNDVLFICYVVLKPSNACYN